MDQKDKNNLKGMIKQCLVNADVFTLGGLVLPIFEYSRTDQIFEFLRKKQSPILDVYEQEDIQQMIILKCAQLFRYHDYSPKFEGISKNDQVLNHGKLPDFLKKEEITDVADFILREFEEPDYSYALIQLSNVKVTENIEINADLILVGDLTVEHDEGYFRIDEKQKEDFRFRLENAGSYLLIRQLGRHWGLLGTLYQEPIVFKNIKQKLKIFLGLSLIRGIFGVTNMNDTPGKKSTPPIGLFSSEEWGEGVEIPSNIQDEVGVGDPVPENHPEFDSIRDFYSEGDDLRYFSFQQRFFLSGEIELPQSLGDLIESFSIGERISKPIIDLNKGKVVQLPLPNVQKGKSSGEYLREEFGRLKILLDSSDDYAERIKAAALWYLEACCADSDTFKFINYTIAIESLLGDQDNESGSLTEALSSRCGFWLGKSLQEKQNIKRQFSKEIYNTRSRIVHEGKTILKKEDKNRLKKLEEWTKQLIANAMDTYLYREFRQQVIFRS